MKIVGFHPDAGAEVTEAAQYYEARKSGLGSDLIGEVERALDQILTNPEAVRNNHDKFPDDYMFEITEGEFADLRSKFSTTKFAKTRALPKAFTEKGLYMIATILTLS